MPMDLVTAERIVVDVLGRQPPETWPPISIVNLAWQSFLDHRVWRWAAGSRAEIVLVADQARYDLPEDFGTILFIGAPSHWTQPVTMVTWRQLEELRAAGYSALLGQPPYVGATRWTEEETGAYTPQLELYPVPLGPESGPLEVCYIPAAPNPAVNGQDLVLGFPPFIRGVWTEWLRQYTLGLIEHDVMGLDERLLRLSQGVLMAAAIHRDSGGVRIRTPTGGAATEYRPWSRMNERWEH